ncbi:MAG: hypothetical protein AVDCRST_MAG39-2599, partial [uncultured Sphingomonadaceae bacterium]
VRLRRRRRDLGHHGQGPQFDVHHGRGGRTPQPAHGGLPRARRARDLLRVPHRSQGARDRGRLAGQPVLFRQQQQHLGVCLRPRAGEPGPHQAPRTVEQLGGSLSAAGPGRAGRCADHRHACQRQDLGLGLVQAGPGRQDAGRLRAAGAAQGHGGRNGAV